MQIAQTVGAELVLAPRQPPPSEGNAPIQFEARPLAVPTSRAGFPVPRLFRHGPPSLDGRGGPRRVGVFAPSLCDGDAVSADTAAMARVLAEAGYDARLLAAAWDTKCHPVRSHAAELPGLLADDGLLIYQHSTHLEGAEQWVARFGDSRGGAGRGGPKRSLRYNNVTPPEFFAGLSREFEAATAAGRRQTADFVRLGFDLYLPASEYNLRDLLDAGAERARCRVVPPLHDTELLEATEADAAVLRRIADGRPKVLCVGRLAPNKNHELLLRSFALLRDSLDRPPRLVIVGAGGGWLDKYVRRLREIARELGIADDVLSTGSVSRSELRAYYQTASVLACASLHEGFCIPLIEAMALRVPVVALARTAVRETVGDGGLLVEEADATTFARALADVITDKELRQRLIEQGRKRYERHFAPRLLRRRFLDAVGPLLESSGRRVGGYAKQTSQVAIIGWNTPQGLGYVNRDLARHLPLARWLLPTHPGFRELDAPETPVVRVSQPSGHWEMRRAVEGLDWLIFCERPYVGPILAMAREQGTRIACIPMWEYLLEDLPWLGYVDLMICPTEACYAMLREWKERLDFTWELAYVPWPIDTTRFRFRERAKCERFLFCNGSGGHRARLREGGHCGPRKGIDIVAAAAKLVPNIPIVVRTQRPVERDGMPRFPPNVEVLHDAHNNEHLYDRGDVAIQPSRWEGLGLQLLECQAAGLPLITTDAAPMNEYEPLVRLPAPTRQVRLFGPRWIDAHEVAPADLAAAIQSLHGRDIRRESHAARAFIERRHCWSAAGPVLKRLLGL